MAETREKYIVSASPVIEIRPDPPAPRHFICWCDTHGPTQHNEEDGCILCWLDYQFEITVAARCPYCGREECSH